MGLCAWSAVINIKPTRIRENIENLQLSKAKKKQTYTLVYREAVTRVIESRYGSSKLHEWLRYIISNTKQNFNIEQH